VDGWQNWKTSYLIDLDLLWIGFYHFLGKVNRRFYPQEEHSLGGGRQELMLEILQDETKFTNKTSGSKCAEKRQTIPDRVFSSNLDE
jgi:hypothetical protein